MPEQLVRPLSRITADLVRDAEVTNALPQIYELCAGVLNAVGSALLVVDPRGRVRVLPTVDDRSELIVLLEAHAGNGPWTESMSTGKAVLVDSIDDDGRWPELSRDAVAAGIRAVGAAPMVLGERSVGSLVSLYAQRPDFGPEHQIVVQTLADLATLSMCQDSDESRAEILARRALSAFDDRVRYEHAVGMAAGRLNTDPTQATTLLREYARIQGVSLVALSRSITSATFDWTELERAIG